MKLNNEPFLKREKEKKYKIKKNIKNVSSVNYTNKIKCITKKIYSRIWLLNHLNADSRRQVSVVVSTTKTDFFFFFFFCVYDVIYIMLINKIYK